MPFKTIKEKEDEIKILEHKIANYLIYPSLTVKFKREVEPNLKAGAEDFLVIREYSTDFKNGTLRGQYFPHQPWGESDKGFRVIADSIPELLDTISYIMDITEGFAFYFTCKSPDMGYPRINSVNQTIKEYKEMINELRQPSEYIRELYYDR